MKNILMCFAIIFIVSSFTGSVTYAKSNENVLPQIVEKHFSFFLPSWVSKLIQHQISSAQSKMMEVEEKHKPLEDKTIVIDPGHGGMDSGVYVNGVHEKDINLSIALKVAEQLKIDGANVFLTRENDKILEKYERYSLPQQVNADIFISIHGNSGENSAHGLETFYYYDRDISLATHVQSHSISETNATNRSIKYSDLYVLRENTVPSVLIETGFLTNPEELSKLLTEEYQAKLANGIARGVKNYFD